MSAPQAERERVADLLYAAMLNRHDDDRYLAMADAVLADRRERDVLAVEAMEARIEAAEARAEAAERGLTGPARDESAQ